MPASISSELRNQFKGNLPRFGADGFPSWFPSALRHSTKQIETGSTREVSCLYKEQDFSGKIRYAWDSAVQQLLAQRAYKRLSRNDPREIKKAASD